MSEDLRTAALEYHAKPRPGKISVEVTKPCLLYTSDAADE